MNNTTDAGYSTPRDTFLYLLGLITLAASAISFGLLVYQIIDLAFPDPLRYGYGYYSPSGQHSVIRGAISVLAVAFPVFYWVSRIIRKDVVIEPEKKNLRIRKWFLYLTVFVASLIIIGDLVALIRNFLEGELTTPFLLKALTIFFIASSALFYYQSELKERSYPRRAFQAVIIGVVLLAVGYGFYVAGTPQQQRLIRFDDQKVSHLQMIQSQVLFHWQQKGSLPANLTALQDPISSFMVPKDPQTGESYEYIVSGPRTFQLCANFNKENDQQMIMSEKSMVYDAERRMANWQHGAGRSCFERTIDPQLYPVRQPNI